MIFLKRLQLTTLMYECVTEPVNTVVSAGHAQTFYPSTISQSRGLKKLWLRKMPILGLIFRCLDPIWTIAAYLSCKPLFVSPIDRWEEATRWGNVPLELHMTYCEEQSMHTVLTVNSDLLMDTHVYNECVKALAGGGGAWALCEFCDEVCDQNLLYFHVCFPSSARGQFFLRWGWMMRVIVFARSWGSAKIPNCYWQWTSG